jgi:hypothetical protein
LAVLEPSKTSDWNPGGSHAGGLQFSVGVVVNDAYQPDASQPRRGKRVEGLVKLTPPGDATVDLWIITFADTEGRVVMSHQVDVGVSPVRW